MARRVMGKLAFLSLRDDSGPIQVLWRWRWRWHAALLLAHSARTRELPRRLRPALLLPAAPPPCAAAALDLLRTHALPGALSASPSPCAPPRRLQLYVDKSVFEASQEGGFDFLKNMVDAGDIVGVSGGIKRTDKGELSVVVKSLQVLTKSLLPLPDKWHGLADVERRYRQRYLDMIVTDETRATMRARSAIVSTIRRFLEDRAFLEVRAGGLGRRSFWGSGGGACRRAAGGRALGLAAGARGGGGGGRGRPGPEHLDGREPACAPVATAAPQHTPPPPPRHLPAPAPAQLPPPPRHAGHPTEPPLAARPP
jgi:hypothetical protein